MILDQIIAGDTLDFVDQVPDYPATDGWTLKYLLAAQFVAPVQASVTLTATTYLTTDYRVQAVPTVTELWAPGVYTWTRWVEKVGARQSLGEGRLEVRANPATLPQGYDGRSVAERALAEAEAALANFQATGGRIKSYSIAGRSMEFDAAGEFLTVISYWRREVMTERASKAKAEGRPDPRRIQIRLTNA
jgi:hypothetical protein